MGKIELPVKPYNELWIDCVSNNMLSVLSAHNEEWTYLPCFSKAYYAKRMLIPEVASEEDFKLYMHEGWLTLQVQYLLPDLQNFFEFNNLQVESQIETFNTIKRKLNQGYYVSIELDRFYFSGGIEYNKKHLVHPTLIYGYDEKQHSFLLLEDCVQLGHLQEYRLSYSDFTLSYQALEVELQQNKTVFHAFKIKPFEQSEFLLNNIRETTIENLNFYLSGCRQDYEDIFYDEYGINAIRCYADYVEDIVYAAHHKEHLYHISKMPFNMQKRNLLLIELMHQFNIINDEQNSLLKKKYEDLKVQWQLLKNKILYYRESTGCNSPTIMDFRERLLVLYLKEKEAGLIFLACLEKNEIISGKGAQQ